MFGELHLSVIGLGTQYPTYSLKANTLDILSKRHYPKSPSLTRGLTIMWQKILGSPTLWKRFFFTDALVLSNGIGQQSRAIYEVLGWDHSIIPGTGADLGFHVDSTGWKAVITPRVPQLTQSAISATFKRLKASLPQLPTSSKLAGDFDWAIHPGGTSILSSTEHALGISAEHMRASIDVYTHHGNSSSASIISVMDRLRSKEMDNLALDSHPREHIIACAFGPGITVEMCMLRRNFGTVQHHITRPNPPGPGMEGGEAGDSDMPPKPDSLRE
ncbi:putative chalcone synthase c protein [Hirsutella rhossiliensis]|uniref:Chalcone synthase c protein n=1 Tax=Hirsutella rhossiliensis TaxID=111463 RepID=A0A9P8SKS6_9HYPO|nr:putative chalcone synthase c protein [Hirsutella rhossiliensis]KAH0965539.1 putative chalcone synthase c protein [Hirsutella rhossiliensis]